MLHILFFISLLQYLEGEELDAAEIPQRASNFKGHKTCLGLKQIKLDWGGLQNIKGLSNTVENNKSAGNVSE